MEKKGRIAKTWRIKMVWNLTKQTDGTVKGEIIINGGSIKTKNEFSIRGDYGKMYGGILIEFGGK